MRGTLLRPSESVVSGGFGHAGGIGDGTHFAHLSSYSDDQGVGLQRRTRIAATRMPVTRNSCGIGAKCDLESKVLSTIKCEPL